MNANYDTLFMREETRCGIAVVGRKRAGVDRCACDFGETGARRVEVVLMTRGMMRGSQVHERMCVRVKKLCFVPQYPEVRMKKFIVVFIIRTRYGTAEGEKALGWVGTRRYERNRRLRARDIEIHEAIVEQEHDIGNRGICMKCCFL